MAECVFEQRGYRRCYRFVCLDCGWASHSADKKWSERAGEVHSEFLKPGHRVEEQDPPQHPEGRSR